MPIVCLTGPSKISGDGPVQHAQCGFYFSRLWYKSILGLGQIHSKPHESIHRLRIGNVFLFVTVWVLLILGDVLTPLGPPICEFTRNIRDGGRRLFDNSKWIFEYFIFQWFGFKNLIFNKIATFHRTGPRIEEFSKTEQSYRLLFMIFQVVGLIISLFWLLYKCSINSLYFSSYLIKYWFNFNKLIICRGIIIWLVVPIGPNKEVLDHF